MKHLPVFPPARFFLFAAILLIFGVTGCAASFPFTLPMPTPTLSATEAPTVTVTPEPTRFPLENIRLYVSEEVPGALRESIHWPEKITLVESRKEANVIFGKSPDDDQSNAPSVAWHYVIAKQFPALSTAPRQACSALLRTEETAAAFSGVNSADLGCQSFKTVPAGDSDLLSAVGADAGVFALIPFEALTPRWQTSGGEEFSDPATTVHFSFSGDPAAIRALVDSADLLLPKTNFDPQKLASVILTGTTAMTRATGVLMDEKGSLYPAEQIGEILRSADITHISNEVPFKADCVIEKSGMQFCSKPEYLGLIKAVGTDVIELTGNHELDFGVEPFLNTLKIYAENGIPYYGGGRDSAEAAQPLKLEVNGNKIAFLGCNAVGPDADLATINTPGANPCDRQAMRAQISLLKSEGYSPIVTFQHMEVCQAEPVPPQRGDFESAARAGAVIVSGSQGHCPQQMEFYGDTVVHFGLGNLFFDQMDKIERMAFLDRYLFYDNKLIAFEPIGIIREDEAQPRLMTDAESQIFFQSYLPAIQ